MNADTARQLLDYEPDTGKLFWRERPRDIFRSSASYKRWNARYAGREALATPDGNGALHGTLLGKSVYAHRIAWLIHHGVWPEEIELVNGDKSDNRLVNLRGVTHLEMMGRRALSRNNTSGVNGVSYSNRDQRWKFQLSRECRLIENESFATKADAIAYRDAVMAAL